MSILFADGFDQFGGSGPGSSGTGSGGDGNADARAWCGQQLRTSGWGATDAYSVSDITPFGEGAAIFPQFGETMGVTLPVASQAIIGSVRAYSDLSGAGWNVLAMCYWDGNLSHAYQYQCTLDVNADGSVSVNCYTNIPEVSDHWVVYTYTTVPGLIAPGTWNQYELYYGCDLTNGTIVLRINGVTVLSLFGVPTVSNNVGNELPDVGFTNEVQIIVLSGSPNIHTRTIYDDFVVVNPLDGINLCDFPGSVRVAAFAPSADTGTHEMTLSTGASSFACVDQFPSSDGGTYLASNAANQSVAFVPGVLPADVIDILAVVPLARGKGDGTASYSTTMALSGQEFVAPAFVPPSANYATNPQMVMELNPQGGSWDINTFPASNIVVTSQASGQLKITDVYTQVIYTKNPNFEWIEMVQYTQFPNDISYGSLSTIGFSTSVVQADSGTNQRTARWDQALRKYNISYGVRTREQLHDLIQFFHAMKGRYYSFLYFDWADYSSNFATSTEQRGVPLITDTDQVIGTGDGTTRVFQLTKTYQTKNGATSHVRLITKPMTEQWTDAQMTIPWSPVLVSLNAWACKNFTVDQMTGLVTFGAPRSSRGRSTACCLTRTRCNTPEPPAPSRRRCSGRPCRSAGQRRRTIAPCSRRPSASASPRTAETASSSISARAARRSPALGA